MRSSLLHSFRSSRVMLSTPTTFSNQAHLPRLPVPDLHQTLDRYIEWSHPVLTTEEHDKVIAGVQELRSSGAAERLHSTLQSWASTIGPNWLEPIWDDMYLGDRGTQIVHVSYTFGLSDLPPALTVYGQAAVAVALINGLLSFKERLDDGTFPPNTIRDSPLSMDQFAKLFNSCRVPLRGRDTCVFAWSEDATPATRPRHILVGCKGRFYAVDVMELDGSARCPTRIYKDLRSILVLSAPAPPDNECLGFMCAAGRETAARVREIVLERGGAEALRAAETAICSISLDESSPCTDRQVTWEGLTGNHRHRFADKPFGIVVFANGRCAIQCEHSSMDGHTTSQLLAHMLDHVHKNHHMLTSHLFPHGPAPQVPAKSQGQVFSRDLILMPDVETTAIVGPQPSVPPDGPLEAIAPLHYELTDEAKELLVTAKAELASVVDDTVLIEVRFDDFGANHLKSLGVSPDAFVQAMFHLAYCQLVDRTHNGPLGQTYESAITKKFTHGRTETLRTGSEDVLNFVKAVDACKRGDAGIDTVMFHLNKACATHSQRVRICMDGQGVDRHLLGLKTMYERHASELGINFKPRLFYDGTYAKYKADMMSTSTLLIKGVHGFTFGPTAPGGFGIGYSVLPDRMFFNITSRRADAKKLQRWAALLREAFVNFAVADLKKYAPPASKM